MRRHPLYSNSGWSKPVGGSGPRVRTPPVSVEPEADEPSLTSRLGARWNGFYARREKPVLILGGVAAALVAVLAVSLLKPAPHTYTQAEISAAVAYALKKTPPAPSRASVAAETIMPSVVRVTGYDATETASHPDIEGRASKIDPKAPKDLGEDGAVSVGSGVVIDEKGTILTNLHVAASAARLKVTFWNGEVSDAVMIGAQPEDDLAVIRPSVLPDDLKPATLVSTRGLKPGDEVVAVGFPFGIGPSVSAGVISGLKRDWQFDADRKARNLIQFDAAANPGNSGGPLVNKDGEVLGIVTGILNPTKQRVWIGIGFAVPIENAAAAAGNSPF